MRRFELAEPQTLEEACSLLGDDGDAKAMAGGTALLTLIKHGIFIPKTLVNLKKIRAVSGIDYNAQRGLRIVCRDLRLIVGAVSPLPVRMYQAEELACDKEVTQVVLQEVGAKASRMVDPVNDLRAPASYKRQLVGVLVRRAIAAVIQKQKELPAWH
jgi:CO/xanthine dehydrogenase FAD-binding subunit